MALLNHYYAEKGSEYPAFICKLYRCRRTGENRITFSSYSCSHFRYSFHYSACKACEDRSVCHDLEGRPPIIHSLSSKTVPFTIQLLLFNEKKKGFRLGRFFGKKPSRT